MEGFSQFTKIDIAPMPLNKDISAQVTFEQKTAPTPNDSVELSTKKEKNPQGFAKVAMFLAAAAAIVGGGTYGGVKIYDKYFQKLASGIKKGEINDALFNFIKKLDPKGKLFNNKEKIIKINEKLTDENFLILKQLSKMKDDTYFRAGINKGRFTLEEIAELLSSTNEMNIKYLDKLAKISDKTMFGNAKGLSADEILKIIKEIKPQNEKIAGQLIEKAGADDANSLLKCIQGVTKENSDLYSLVLTTRKKGGSTELTFEEISKIVKTLEETNNPKCAELFLNLQKKDGTGLYRYNTDAVCNYLKTAKEENLEAYKQLHNLKSAESIEDIKPLLESVNNENISVLEPLLTKDYQCLNEKYVIFDDWDCIKDILKETNEKNKDIVQRIIDICDDNYVWNAAKMKKTQNLAVDLIREINESPAKLEKVTEILNNGMVDSQQTLGIKEFFKEYKGWY